MVPFSPGIALHLKRIYLVLWAGLDLSLILNPGWPALPRILAWVTLTPLLSVLWIWNAPPWPQALQLLGTAALTVSSFLRQWR